MDKRLKIILRVFAFTLLAVIGYTIYLIKTIDESESIVLLFWPFFVAGGLYFIECILFAIIYIRHLKKVWFLLLPVFLISSLTPIYFLKVWLDRRPVSIPKPGKLAVTIEEYNKDKLMIIDDYELKDQYYRNTNDIIKVVDVDTIIYSPDKSKFFSIIMTTAIEHGRITYNSSYRVGLKNGNEWKLAEPRGNIWLTDFYSIPEFKYGLRQYFYKKYSINGSSDKPEIWEDDYIFPFK